MKLRRKITAATSLAGLFLMIMGVSAAWHVLRLQQSHSQILDVNVTSIRAAEELELTVREMRHELDQFLISKKISNLSHAKSQEPEVRKWLDKAIILSTTNQESKLLEAVKRGLDNFFAKLSEVVKSTDSTDSTAAVEEMADEILTKQVLATAHNYLDLNELELQESNKQNQEMAERLALVLLLLGTCGAIAGLVVGYGISRGISRSILQLSVPIRDVAGKLNEVVGPVEFSADPNVMELETILQKVSGKVENVVEQLQQRHREIVRADQLVAVGQLAAGLAHEIRNPLMCMKTLVQSARRDGEQSKLDSQDLAILDEEITRLNSLLQAFLDFARPAKPDVDDVDLIDLATQTVGLIAGKTKTRHVTVECNFPETPLVVQGDKTQLKQVLLNLLLNALDAVPNEGAIWIDAGLRKSSTGNSEHKIVLRVSDNGRGLPAENCERIFEPFFSTRETGLGLGLAISKRIVEAHNGTISATDREPKGTTFEVLFPSLNNIPASPSPR